MFDATTLAAYGAAETAAAKAQAVSDSLGSGTLTVEIHDGETLKYQGTFAGPLTVGQDGTLSKAVTPAGVVVSSGTPSASTYTLKIRNADGSRYIVDALGEGGRFNMARPLVAGQGVRLNISIAPAAVGGGDDPMDLPLVTEQTFSATHLGYFNTRSDFEYGGSGMAIGPDNSLYLAGLHQDASVGRLTIPAIEGLATTVKAPVTIPGSTISSAPSGYRNGGTLVYNDRVIVAKLTYYEAPMTAWCCAANIGLTSFGSINGMTLARGGRIRAFCSGMGHVPAEWQDVLGGPAFAFGGSLQQISEASCGPAFGVFDPDDVNEGGGNVPFSDLLWYDDSRPVEPFTPAHAGFTQYNSAGGTDYLAIQTLKTGTAFIYPGSRSLLFVYGHGYGPYGNAGSDGCYQGSSVHSAPFRLQVVAYDLRDLVAVKNGTKNPWEPKPYGWWLLGPDDYGALGVCVYLEQGCFTFDPTNRKLYGCRELESGDSGKIQVWDIGTL